MTPFSTLEDINQRGAEAIIAQSGLSHAGLKAELRALFSGARGAHGRLMSEPVLEAAHPYIPAKNTLAEVPADVLHPRFVEIVSGLDEKDEYRFPGQRRPFRHQYEAWRTLSDHKKPQSVLVTSGTGSGKTECFLFPILSDLTRQAQAQNAPLEGVQALMLYPLNALIESQRLRLSAWTRPLNGKVRYALYNGDMDNDLKADVRRSNLQAEPERVPDRKILRETPPPVLVTNITMLEYMLARIEDQPIIEKSRGKLKWIVLDEAHSFVGAAAAEIALLLRRVLLAFDVRPEEVHFVATSATIGEGADTLQRLKAFLAEIGGIGDDQVHVIEGGRQLPGRPLGAGGLTDLASRTPQALYDGLGSDPDIWSLVEGLLKAARPLSAFEPLARRYGTETEDFIAQLSRAARSHPVTGESERLLPLRIHAFERSVPGIWACLNPDCGPSIPDWPFGRLFSERADQCPDCRSPALEILSCIDCGTPMLTAVEGRQGRLVSPGRPASRDEFAAEAARDVDEADDDEASPDEAPENEPVTLRQYYLMSAKPSAAARMEHIDLATGCIVGQAGEGIRTFRVELRNDGDVHCPCCGANPRNGAVIRPLRFGAPFMIGNAAPLLLDGVTPKVTDNSAPYGGRGLLSFTDSRQGTARMSARIQAEAERNFVRSFIYHSVQHSLTATQSSKPEAENIRSQLAALATVPAPPPPVLAMIEDLQRKLAGLTQANTQGIAWNDLIDRLSERIETHQWIAEVWGGREADYNQPRRLAEFLILRELARRPRHANSVETLGLARLRFPIIDECGHVPDVFLRHGKSLQDWKDYLSAIVTHFVRNNRCVDFADVHRNWLLPRQGQPPRPGYLKGLLPPGQSFDGTSRINWPVAHGQKGNRSGPVAMLVRGLGLDLTNTGDRDDLDDCLRAAWDRISMLLSSNPDRRGLDFTKAFVAPVTKAYICPETRRLLDVAPFGLTPYGQGHVKVEKLKVQAVDMPSHPMPKLGQFNEIEASDAIRDWLSANAVMQKLREGGQWNNISDRVAYFAQYARSAEHSAQQPSKVLRRYEEDFKDGQINILNCSTTMEMGVDIGSVSTVMMTNVPPSIANYRQRVGRAGRRGQAMSLAFTYCKDRPLDREAFSAPLKYLDRGMAPPKVALSSRPIVQRHVNAYLLRAFLIERAGDALRMKIGAFMGCTPQIDEARVKREERPVGRFSEWLGLPDTRNLHREALQGLVARSVLEGETGLLDDAKAAIDEVETRFVFEWQGFQDLAREEGGAARQSRMGVELNRLCDDFLLSALADRGFLPGHGFPNHVVTFIPKRPPHSPETADGRRSFRAAGPQRSLDLAIRDYAPGSEVVLDGLVHRSAGVTLNWKRPASEEKVSEVQSLSIHWHCNDCGASDSTKRFPEGCTACGSANFDQTEYLQPAGFTVDPRENYHADTDTISYVPAQPPEVSTRDAPWRALPWPDTGRMRQSRIGRVFYANHGPEGNKYALCLHCGRAETEPLQGSDHQPLLEHRPLRWGRTESHDRCQGNDNAWKIKRHIALGHEITTDVLELQLARTMSEGAANALAIALRESLARQLGIEADEMGFATRMMPGPYAAVSPSLLLFDKAAGGAGFAVSIEDYLESVLKGCEDILDCRTPGCVKACAACVLTSDAPDREDALDRVEALDYLRAYLLRKAELAPEDRLVPNARLSISVLNEIHHALRAETQTRRLYVYLPPDADLAGLNAWVAASDLAIWSRRGYPVTLVAPPDWLKSLDVASRMTLRDFVLRSNISLARGPSPLEGIAVLAVVEGPSSRQVWACREAQAVEISAYWGQATNAPVICGTLAVQAEVIPVVLDTLLPKPGARFKTITTELDQMIDRWGKVMARHMLDQFKACGVNVVGNITQLTYYDPYVRSPMVGRLFLDTVAALQDINGAKIPVILKTDVPVSDRGSPWLITHAWSNGEAAAEGLMAYARRLGIDLTVELQKVPHGRYMLFRTAQGREMQIVMDQGFGAWSLPRGSDQRFRFTADPDTQAVELSAVNGLVQRQSHSLSYIVAVAE
ncbi:MAG: DEAD/DEAH box helicase [Asticcacaulis sp.]|nr:DEAD/DEAH box helicase [Asticcacaulis sp.]